MKYIITSLIFATILSSGIPLTFADEVNPLVVIVTTSGNITLELFPDDAPKHVANFMNLANAGFYDGTLFHRVIPGFMIQGGDPNTKDLNKIDKWGFGSDGTLLDEEFNDIRHLRGILSMARSADPNSAGTQFFIVHQDSQFLNGQYTVFGRVITEESFATLDKIANVETGDRDIPTNLELVKITGMKVVEYRDTKYPLEQVEVVRFQDLSLIPDLEPVFFVDESVLGVKFSVPAGWQFQAPQFKTDENAPDVIAVGPTVGAFPEAITLTIKSSDGKSFGKIVSEKINKLESMIESNKLEIISTEERRVAIGGQGGYHSHTLLAESTMQTDDGIVNLKFVEILIYTTDKYYTFAYASDGTIGLTKQVNTLWETADSFEILPHNWYESIPPTTPEIIPPTTPEIIPPTTPEIIPPTTPEINEEGGGCLIATAAYGSEMAPQVQFLRELRDNTVLQTQVGTNFMTEFNQFYYSFSPAVADYERENPMFKEAVKLTLTPLLTSLAVLNYVDIDTEQEMLGYGIGVILLNIGMYFVAPAAVIIAIKNRRK
jgi:peptidyl-prolyl cis-trans isomerase B (cyclophilin B)